MATQRYYHEQESPRAARPIFKRLKEQPSTRSPRSGVISLPNQQLEPEWEGSIAKNTVAMVRLSTLASFTDDLSVLRPLLVSSTVVSHLDKSPDHARFDYPLMARLCNLDCDCSPFACFLDLGQEGWQVASWDREGGAGLMAWGKKWSNRKVDWQERMVVSFGVVVVLFGMYAVTEYCFCDHACCVTIQLLHCCRISMEKRPPGTLSQSGSIWNHALPDIKDLDCILSVSVVLAEAHVDDVHG